MNESETTVITIRCCNCGVPFGMDAFLLNLRKTDGQSFYCPNGHGQNYKENLVSRFEKVKTDLKYWQEEAARLLEENDKLRQENIKLKKGSRLSLFGS